jgi:hypothetical protein
VWFYLLARQDPMSAGSPSLTKLTTGTNPVRLHGCCAICA